MPGVLADELPVALFCLLQLLLLVQPCALAYETNQTQLMRFIMTRGVD